MLLSCDWQCYHHVSQRRGRTQLYAPRLAERRSWEARCPFWRCGKGSGCTSDRCGSGALHSPQHPGDLAVPADPGARCSGSSSLPHRHLQRHGHLCWGWTLAWGCPAATWVSHQAERDPKAPSPSDFGPESGVAQAPRAVARGLVRAWGTAMVSSGTSSLPPPRCFSPPNPAPVNACWQKASPIY